jgi:hypothetical protein
MNTQTTIKNNISKKIFSAVLPRIMIYGFLAICAIFGSIANTVCALIVLAIVIYCDIKISRGT